MPTLGIDRDFLFEFGRLQRSVQDKVAGVFAEFEHATHTGLHLEKISGVRDPRLRSIRIDQFWRGIVIAPASGEVFTLLRVLPHDDAYAWARRQRASVNRATGVIEIRDAVAVADDLPELVPRTAEAEPLLAGIGDADLARLGIDDDVLPFARRLTDTAQLEQARAIIPEPQYDVLLGLAAGLSAEEVWAELAGAGAQPGGYDPDDLAAAISRSGRRIVMVEGPDELMEVFARPFAGWRVFLHPAQRRAAYATYGGPARVTGGPGTGKTVAALHRALHLARCSPADRSVLLTTFTRTLTAALEDDLRVLVDDEALLRRVDVRGLDQLAHGIVRAAHGPPDLLPRAEEARWWEELARQHGIVAKPAFLSQEWRGVVLTHGIEDRAGYLSAPRSGRGRPLSAAQRGETWPVFDGFVARLRRERRWTHETVCAEATRLLAQGEDRPYRHVIVDEAQDLAPWQWRLLRAAVAPGPDDMFVAGDSHQRIYTHRVSLRRLGVDVAGRSTTLRLNYRTTAEILAWSVGLLHGRRIEGIDADIETLTGCRSEVHGPVPTTEGFPTTADEQVGLVDTVRTWIDDGIEPERIGVSTRTASAARTTADVLRASGLSAAVLGDAPPRDGEIRVATMHRMKGLEFRCVAVLGIGDATLPLAAAVTSQDDDAVTHDLDVARERCLLFVACTRAREQLSVSWSGRRSPFLAELT